MSNYLKNDVFTPTRPARVAFVERDSVNDKLVNSLTTPGKQIVVYGHSGSGKTTLLLNKLHQLYECHIVTRCMKGVKFEQIILDAFDQLSPYYTTERTQALKITSSLDIGGAYAAIQAKLTNAVITEAQQKETRILPPQLTPQALGRFLGATGCCWVIEDFHKVDESEKAKLSQLMKVFMDLSDEFPDLKIVALGAVDTARQVVDYDPEMRNRVAEIHVGLMTEKEISEIISKGEAALNIEFGKDIKKLISTYSNGVASVCHHICLNMCGAAGVIETIEGPTVRLNQSHFERAVKLYVEEASDSIKSSFDKALKQRRKTKFDNATLLLEALSKFGDTGASRIEIQKKINAEHPTYPEANLRSILQKSLTEEYGAVVRYDSNSGRYSFSDPIYRAFALAHFRDKSKPATSVSQDDFEQLLTLLTNELRRQLPGRFTIAIGAKRPADT